MSLYSKIIDQQKLMMAWDRVKKNRPACGVDHVTWEMYDEKKKENIRQLNIELTAHEYKPLPVKLVTIYREEKAREIALYAMRDKNVQQAIAVELTRIYDSRFSRCAYAYRPDKSALAALDEIEGAIKNLHMLWSVKLDIAHFFDTIDVRRLKVKLTEGVREEDVLDLIVRDCTAPSLTDDGELVEKKRGIYQGSAIAPILSNIYMMDFDREMEQACPYYVRYSDDILILTRQKEQAEALLSQVKLWMERIGLALNEKKTCIRKISEGFQFLGYEFNESGKTIPVKAQDNLAERLETMWYSNKALPIEERLQKGAEILDGWTQYFRGDRSLSSICEYAVILYMTEHKDVELPKEFLSRRKELQNTDKTLCKWLADRWGRKSEPGLELMEYEDYYQLSGNDTDVIIKESYLSELVGKYRALIVEESEELYTDIMQAYSDAGSYNKASAVMDRLHCYKAASENRSKPVISLGTDTDSGLPQVKLTKEQLDIYFRNFVGRDDTYAEETIERTGRRSCVQVFAPLDDEVLKKHMAGQLTAATYVQRGNATAKYLVIDIDVSRKVLLESGSTAKSMEPYMQKAANLTAMICGDLRRLGLTGYIEESGFRGYHIWILFTEWIPVRYIHLLEDIIEQKAGEVPPELSIEFFPNKARIVGGKPGQSVKLPFGFHVKSGRQSRFLTEYFQPVEDMGKYISEMARFSLLAVKRIIGATESAAQQGVQMVEKKVDEDLSAFQGASDNVLLVLRKCNLMRYLCQKAHSTGYLTHFERLSLLYVFGHMGEEGEEFLHMVMGFTLNYQYHVTQKFISKMPAKPVSCIKLRDQYQKITAEYGCSCNFNRIKNCYPSPVLHAIKAGQDEDSQITLPTSRTLSKEKEAQVCDELNMNKKVRDITAKILEFKKQKRGIDKNIDKLEKELEKLFDDAGIDCMEVEYGMLVRRKTQAGYEWIVEI